MVEDEVPTHIENRTLEETVIIARHKARKKSAAFEATKRRLKQDGFWRCYICNLVPPRGKRGKGKLEVHHILEWSLWPLADPEKLRRFLLDFDPYGYSRLLRDRPIESPDDIRNLLVLCPDHHRGSGKDGAANGVHYLTFPIWLAQKVAKDGANPVPQDGRDPDGVAVEIDRKRKVGILVKEETK